MSAVVDVRGLDVTTPDGVALLTGVDLVIDAGEQVLLVGASGSGKSTLLRVLAGLEATPGGVVTGSARVAGVELVGRDSEEAPPLDLGWLPQDPAAAVCLPLVEDDVALGCENRGWAVDRIEGAVGGALGLVDAAGLRARDSGTLSAGQAQRVGLAGAVAPDPAVLLLDEPTALLDPHALGRVRDALARLAAEGGPPAVLLVEHRLDEWADGGALPDRVVVLDGGRVRFDGDAESAWSEVGSVLADAGCHLPWAIERSLAAPPPRHHPTVEGEPHRRGRAGPDSPSTGGLALDGGGVPRGGGAALLRTRGLAVGRGAVVVGGIDLELAVGEVVAVIGANGSGKTTLLLTLAGLLRPVAGRIEQTGGRPALAFGDPELQLLEPTVAEELAAAGVADDVGVLADLGLTAAAERSAHRLSGGEQRRLTLATVMHGARRIVLADEPTRSLDRAGVRWATRVVRDAAAAGRSVLLTSHDLRFVLETADRVLAVHDGALIGGGPPAQTLHELAHRVGLPLPTAVREQWGVRA